MEQIIDTVIIHTEGTLVTAGGWIGLIIGLLIFMYLAYWLGYFAGEWKGKVK